MTDRVWNTWQVTESESLAWERVHALEKECRRLRTLLEDLATHSQAMHEKLTHELAGK